MAGTQTIGNLVVNLLFDDKGLVTGTAKAQTKLSGFANKIGDIAGKIDRQLTIALGAATAAVTALGTAAVLTGAQFEKRMDEVAAVSRATEEELKQLTDTARDIGETTAFSASQAADGMINLARAGFDVNQIISATRASLVLAGAGNIDLAKATDLVASTIRQFSLDASEANRIADVFTTVTQQSRFSLETLAESMKYAGTVGAGLGLSLEETTAGVAQFINLGLEASTAGTNFRESMLSLVNPGKKAREALALLNLTVADVNPQVVGFEGAMQALGDAGLDAAAAMDIFGLRSGANVAKIASTFANGTEEFRELREALLESAGTAELTYQQMLDNVLGDVAIFKSTIEELFLSIFEVMQGPLRRLLTELTDRVRTLQRVFSGMGDETGDIFDRIVDGILKMVDAAIRLLPHLQNIGIAMVAAFVASKGVSYLVSIAQLATAIGINLAGAITTATTALAGLSVAGGFLFGAAVAGTVAAIGLITAALADMVSELTGAKKAAQELNAELNAGEQIRLQAKVDLDLISETLQKQQALIRERVDAGEAISEEERALLKLNAAQAQAKVLAGDLLDVGGRLVDATQLDTETRKDAAAVLQAQADQWKLNAERAQNFLDHLERFGSNAGFGPVSDQIDNFMNSPMFREAESLIGVPIESMQDLANAAALFGRKAEDAEARSKLMLNALADQTAATRKAAEGQKEWTDNTVEGNRALERQQAELDKLNKALADELLERLDNKQAALDLIHAAEDEAAAAKVARREELERLAQIGLAMRRELIPALEEVQGRLESWDPVLDFVMSQVEKLGQQFLKAMGDLAVKGLEMAKNAAMNLLDTIVSLFAPLFEITALIKDGQDAAEGILDLDAKAADAAQAAAEAQEALNEARAEGAETSEDELERLMQAAEEAEQLANEAAQAARDARADVGLEPGASVEGREAEIAAAQVSSRAEEIVGFVTAVAEAMPLIIEALIDELPKVIEAVNEKVPEILDAVIAGLPDLVAAAAEQTPVLIDAILQRVPDLLEAIGDGLKSIISTLPELITSVLSNTDEIITALIDMVVEVVIAFVEELPAIFKAIVDALPDIIIAIVEAVPTIFAAIIEAIPEIFLAVVGLVPELIFAIIELIPRILVALGEGMLQVASAFWNAIVDFFTEGIPNLAKAFWDQMVEFWTETIPRLAEDLGQRIADFFLEIVTLGLHKSKKQREANANTQNLEMDTEALLALAEEQGLDVSRAQAGIEFVPRTMATILEPGEGVLDALSNARRLAKGPGMEFMPPAPGAGLSGPGMPGSAGRSIFEFIVQMDTQVVDAQLIDGVEEGRAPRTRRALRAASGTRTGFRRGRLQPWGR